MDEQIVGLFLQNYAKFVGLILNPFYLIMVLCRTIKRKAIKWNVSKKKARLKS